MQKKFKQIAGFTLIEALVGVTIIGVIGVILVDIISRSSKTSNKSQLIGVIKQNGQVALNIIGSTIRDSDNVVCPVIPSGGNSVTSNVVTTVKDGVYMRFQWSPLISGQNRYIYKDLPSFTDPRTATDLCNVADVPPLVPLTSTDPQTGVTVTDLTFTRTSSPGYKDTVTVQFKLLPGVSIGGGFENQLGEGDVTFKTTVQLR